MKKPSASKSASNPAERPAIHATEPTASPKDSQSNLPDPFLIRMSIDLNPRLSPAASEILTTYGKSPDGRHFTRDVIVPGDITLYGLHYAINRAFGFHGSPFYGKEFRFHLSLKRLKDLTGDSFIKLHDFYGVFLHLPLDSRIYYYMDADDPYADIDRNKLGGTFRGPYAQNVDIESYAEQQIDAKSNLAFYKKHVFKTYGIKDTSLKDYINSFNGYTLPELKFDLPLASVIAPPRQKLLDGPSWNAAFSPKTPTVFPPLTKEILYEYNFIEKWKIFVTRHPLPKTAGIDEALQKVQSTYAPVCIAKTGRMLLDDIGGTGGYIDLLEAACGTGPYSGRFDSREDARYQASDILDDDIPPSEIFPS